MQRQSIRLGCMEVHKNFGEVFFMCVIVCVNLPGWVYVDVPVGNRVI